MYELECACVHRAVVTAEVDDCQWQRTYCRQVRGHVTKVARMHAHAPKLQPLVLRHVRVIGDMAHHDAEFV
jgi:hypothetical protein